MLLGLHIHAPKLFIVIPAYNEETNIGSVLEQLIPLYQNIIVIDDCSSDDTYSVIKRYPVWAVRHSINLGQGAALQTGNEMSLKLGADVIVHFDADGQHRLQDISAMIDPLIRDEVDVVFGSRFLGKTSNLPWVKRHIILPIGKVVNWFFTGLWLTDAHNGFRAMNKKAAKIIILRQNRMAHATEILSQIKNNHLRYMETPVIINYNEYGQGFVGGIKVVRDLIIKSVFK